MLKLLTVEPFVNLVAQPPSGGCVLKQPPHQLQQAFAPVSRLRAAVC